VPVGANSLAESSYLRSLQDLRTLATALSISEFGTASPMPLATRTARFERSGARAWSAAGR
jgi:Flp pilus assembly protein CpaB